MLELDDIQYILLTRVPALTGRYEFLSFREPPQGRAWLEAVRQKVPSAKAVFDTVVKSKWGQNKGIASDGGFVDAMCCKSTGNLNVVIRACTHNPPCRLYPHSGHRWLTTACPLRAIRRHRVVAELCLLHPELCCKTLFEATDGP